MKTWLPLIVYIDHQGQGAYADGRRRPGPRWAAQLLFYSAIVAGFVTRDRRGRIVSASADDAAWSWRPADGGHEAREPSCRAGVIHPQSFVLVATAPRTRCVRQPRQPCPTHLDAAMDGRQAGAYNAALSRSLRSRILLPAARRYIPCMYEIGLVHMQVAALVAHRTVSGGGPGIAALVVVVAAFVGPLAAALLIASRASRPGHRDDGSGDSDWGGGGSGGPRGPDRPPPPTPDPPRPDSGLTWWPEFERQFAAYVDHERRVRSVVTTVPLN